MSLFEVSFVRIMSHGSTVAEHATNRLIAQDMQTLMQRILSQFYPPPFLTIYVSQIISCSSFFPVLSNAHFKKILRQNSV
jgi:hypothetical protein